jgi:replicative DNA helicase Mcm
VIELAIESKEELLDAYESFFTLFQTDLGEFKYIDQINRMIRDGDRSLRVDYEDLVLAADIHDLDLASTVVVNPYFAIEIGAEALGNHVRIENEDYFREVTHEKDQFSLRFTSTPSKIHIRDLRASNVDSLKWLEGIIIRTTEIKSIITEAIYLCNEQQHENRLLFTDGIFVKPDRCLLDTCKAKDFSLDSRQSKLIDWQFVTLQEKPEDLPPGASPKSIPCRLIDDIVNAVRPGDRVQIGGIIRTRPTKQMKKGQVLTYDIWIDVNYVESLTKEDEYTIISPEEETYFLELAQDPKIHEHIRQSLAPAIYGMEEIKEAALAMLFSGVDKLFPDGFSTRGQPNVLIVGDPGTAKSQLLRYVQAIAPRGLYTSGKGSSAAGLTAAIIRDPDTSEITLEAGALVLADRGVCLIDEFDKMNENDRSAIHEAMEQHSYHPSTELRLADGKIVKIGSFVNDLFNILPERFIQGINCEILPISDHNFLVNSTDFKELKEIPINRVSRHKAPDHFVKMKFGNGRQIIVTPEHPIYTFNEAIVTQDANNIQKGMFVPAPRSVTYNGSNALKNNFNLGRKKILLPKFVNASLVEFLGYFVAEGYSYKGSSYEVGLSNTNLSIIEKMKNTISDAFHLEPIDYIEENRTLRIISIDLYEYLSKNFPEILTYSISKRIPEIIFHLDDPTKIIFLRAAFEGDGSVETETCSYNTSSKGLAHDYQDLLATLGIFTRISEYDYLYENEQKRRKRYKVYIRGDSLSSFTVIAGSSVKAGRKLSGLVERSLKDNYNHDVLPPGVAIRIIECLKKLGIAYDGVFHQHLTGNYGITRHLVLTHLKKMRTRVQAIKRNYHRPSNIRSLRKVINYSQEKIAQLIHTSRNRIDYIERGGYSIEQRSQLVKAAKMAIRDLIISIEEQLDYVEKLTNFRWLKVKKTEIVQNQGNYKTDWVYDITVEPTRNFVSQNLILHNTVSVAKAGIVATLNARTGVMAAANPKYGRYEPNRSFSENVNLSPAILSRFDLVFVIKDEPDISEDSVLAEHILKLHRYHGSAQTTNPPLNEEQLKKYIAYSKAHYNPTITEEAAELIENYYVNMRSAYAVTEKGKSSERVTITARQLEGIIRLAEARARAAFRNQVTKQDAQNAIDLMQFSLNQIATDPETGQHDIDAFYSGQTVTKRNKLTKLLSIIDFLYRDAGGKFEEAILYDEAEKEGISEEYAKGVVQQMRRDGSLYQPQAGWLDKP